MIELHGEIIKQEGGKITLFFQGKKQERVLKNPPEESLVGTFCVSDNNKLKFPKKYEVMNYGEVTSADTSFVVAIISPSKYAYEFANKHLSHLDFVKIYHEAQKEPFILQVARLTRESGYLRLLLHPIGKIPPNPFRIGAQVIPASESEIYTHLNMDTRNSIYMGKLARTEIRAFAPIFSCENGINIWGEKNSGKTHTMRVICEGVSEIGRAAFLYDFYGDLMFKFKAEMTDLHKKFGVAPRALNNIYLSAGSNSNPFADAHISDITSVLNSDEFYMKFLKPNTITTLSFKGISDLKAQQKYCAIIANKLINLGKMNKLPEMLFGLDEAYHFAQEGRTKKETSPSHDPLMFLSSSAGHLKIMPIFISQRHAYISKDITSPNPTIISHKLQLLQDTERLPKGMKLYSDLMSYLPQGRCIVQGIFPFTAVLDIRPSCTRHFRDVKQIFEYYEGECKGKYEPMAGIQKQIDKIERTTEMMI